MENWQNVRSPGTGGDTSLTADVRQASVQRTRPTAKGVGRNQEEEEDNNDDPERTLLEEIERLVLEDMEVMEEIVILKEKMS